MWYLNWKKLLAQNGYMFCHISVSCGKDCRQVMPVYRSRLSWIFLKAKIYDTVQETYHLPVLRYREILIYASIKINEKKSEELYINRFNRCRKICVV